MPIKFWQTMVRFWFFPSYLITYYCIWVFNMKWLNFQMGFWIMDHSESNSICLTNWSMWFLPVVTCSFLFYFEEKRLLTNAFSMHFWRTLTTFDRKKSRYLLHPSQLLHFLQTSKSIENKIVFSTIYYSKS